MKLKGPIVNFIYKCVKLYNKMAFNLNALTLIAIFSCNSFATPELVATYLHCAFYKLTTYLFYECKFEIKIELKDQINHQATEVNNNRRF